MIQWQESDPLPPWGERRRGDRRGHGESRDGTGAVTATTQGTGEVIRPVSTGCGASSSVSAPRPLMRAPAWPVLGARFLDRQGRELPPGGASLLPSTVCDPQAPSRRDLAQLGLDGFRQVAGRSVIGAASRRSAPLVVMPTSGSYAGLMSTKRE
jgi:hypothetical protein